MTDAQTKLFHKRHNALMKKLDAMTPKERRSHFIKTSRYIQRKDRFSAIHEALWKQTIKTSKDKKAIEVARKKLQIAKKQREAWIEQQIRDDHLTDEEWVDKYWKKLDSNEAEIEDNTEEFIKEWK